MLSCLSSATLADGVYFHIKFLPSEAYIRLYGIKHDRRQTHWAQVFELCKHKLFPFPSSTPDNARPLGGASTQQP